MDKINLDEKFGLFIEHWTPKLLGQLNGQDVRIAKLKGEFIWHNHANEDELFLVIKGKLKIEFRDKMVTLQAGEMIIVPRGVDHKPIAEKEVKVLLFEPSEIKHTGEIDHELTVDNIESI